MLISPWEELVAFIGARDPGFGERVAGATEERILERQALDDVALPSAYAGFLSAMGEDLAGFALFPNHYTTISDVLGYRATLSGWPFDYSSSDFLPIGYEWEDLDEAEGDICLALKRGDAADPPVVLVDPSEESDEPSGLELGPSFTEYAQDQAFAQYERLRRAHVFRVSCPHVPLPDEAWTAAKEVMSRCGAAASLPGGRGLWFGETDAASVSLKRKGALLVANIAGEDDESVRRLAETLQDQLDLAWASAWTRRDHTPVR